MDKLSTEDYNKKVKEINEKVAEVKEKNNQFNKDL